MVPLVCYEAVLLHLGKLVAQGRALNVQVVCKLLARILEVERVAAVPFYQLGEIGYEALPYRLWTRVYDLPQKLDASGNGDEHKVLYELVVAFAGLFARGQNSLCIHEYDMRILQGSDCLQQWASRSAGIFLAERTTDSDTSQDVVRPQGIDELHHDAA